MALAPVGADRVERTEFELSVTSRELNVAHEVLVLGVQCCEFVGEHHVGFRRSRVDVHDVGQLTAPVHRPQHAHDRSDATAGGDEQDLLRWRIRQREVARRRGQSNDGSRRHGPADEVAREKASGMALTAMEMRLFSQLGGEVSEYDRQCQRPSICRPMPMYCPGW